MESHKSSIRAKWISKKLRDKRIYSETGVCVHAHICVVIVYLYSIVKIALRWWLQLFLLQVQLLARPMSCFVRIPPSPVVLCFSVYDLLVAENVEKSTTGGSTEG